MGENQKQPFQMSFNRFLRVAFQGSRVTSNGGPGAGVGRAIGIRKTRTALGPSGKQCAVVCGPATAVGVQSPGWVRGGTMPSNSHEIRRR